MCVCKSVDRQDEEIYEDMAFFPSTSLDLGDGDKATVIGFPPCPHSHPRSLLLLLVIFARLILSSRYGNLCLGRIETVVLRTPSAVTLFSDRQVETHAVFQERGGPGWLRKGENRVELQIGARSSCPGRLDGGGDPCERLLASERNRGLWVGDARRIGIDGRA